MAPNVVAAAVTTPLRMEGGGPQFTSMHIGVAPVHSPSLPHFRDITPLRTDPVKQVYVAMAPRVVDGRLTLPPVGMARGPQSTNKQDGSSPDQVPFCWQTLWGMPFSKLPSLQLYFAIVPTSLGAKRTLPLAGLASMGH